MCDGCFFGFKENEWHQCALQRECILRERAALILLSTTIAQAIFQIHKTHHDLASEEITYNLFYHTLNDLARLEPDLVKEELLYKDNAVSVLKYWSEVSKLLVIRLCFLEDEKQT